MVREEELRQVADWRAFRAGRELWERGVVLEVEETESGWVGRMRDGERVRRVVVEWKSVREAEVKCGCAERVKRGVFCAHGVATGLALVLGKREVREKSEPLVVREISREEEVGYRVIFAENWRVTLGNQRLGVRLEKGEVVHGGLSRFLREQGVRVGGGGHLLDLRAGQVLGFFRGLEGHGDVWFGEGKLGRVGGSGCVEVGGQLCGEKLVLRVEREKIFRVNGTNWVEEDGNLVEVVGARGDWWSAWQRGEAVEMDFVDWLREEERYAGWVRLGLGDAPTLRGAKLHQRLLWDVSGGSIGWKTEIFYEVAGGRVELGDLPIFRAGVWWLGESREEQRAVDEAGRLLGGERGVVRGEAEQVEFVTRTFRELERLGWRVAASKRAQVWRAELRVVRAKWEEVGREGGEVELRLGYEGERGEVISREEVQGMLRGGGGGRVLVDRSEEGDVSDLLASLPGEMRGGVWVGAPAAAEVVAAFYGKVVEKKGEFLWPRGVGGEICEKLRGYQREGIGWILSRWSVFGGALLADDMGLGKTWQSIVAAEVRLEEKGGCALVVVPTSLLSNWVAEWEMLASGRELVVLHGAERERRREQMGGEAVILTTFQTLARDLAWHLQQRYEVMVVDEASLLRNPDTDVAKAVAKMQATCRLALTGTPVENRVRDLWSIFRWVQPGWLGTREEFVRRYEGEDGNLGHLQCKLAPFFLRRVKEDVAKDLPAKLILHEWCDLSGEQKGMLGAIEEESRKMLDEVGELSGAGRMRVLTALLRMRQACCDLALLKPELSREKSLRLEQRSGKLQRLMELVEEVLASGRKMLIFSQFREQLRLIELLLGERGVASVRLDGQTRDRGEKVARFQAKDGPPVFLISLKAGGYGLNLTEADVVVHFDPWWNPAAEAQATDRAHRIGQTKPVTVYRLISRGSVEEGVLRMQEKKRETAAALVGGEVPDWTMEEFRALLGEG